VVNLRSYGDSSYKTLEFSMNGTKVGQIDATTNKLKDYTWTPSTTLSGSGKLRFYSKTNTAENGPALSSITIKTTGGGTGTTTTYVYSRYITSCEGTATENVEVQPSKQGGKKILSEGQLLIEYNGVYYNTLGQPMKP
jgi:hypothetical protein